MPKGRKELFLVLNVGKRRLFAFILVLCTFCILRVLVFSANVLNGAAALNPHIDDGVFVPIIMYHSILHDPNRAGKYVISPEVLESDMLYLKNNGYTSIVVGDLIKYVESDVPLPEKPVLLTFDDGYLNNLTYLLPLLEKHDMRACVAVVGAFTEKFSREQDHNPNYSYMSWDDIKAITASGRVEIENHSYGMHEEKSRKGSMKRSGETLSEYQEALFNDLTKLQTALSDNCGITPCAFVYPYGEISAESVDVLKAIGFKASFGCREIPNYISKDPDSLFSLGRYNRPSGISTEKFMDKALKK